MTIKQTQVLRTEEALSVYDTLKLALEALKKSDDFLYNWHENYSDDEADAYAAARQLNEQAIIAAEKALMSVSDGAQPEQEPVMYQASSDGGKTWFQIELGPYYNTMDEYIKDLQSPNAVPVYLVRKLYTTPPTQQSCSQRPSRSDMTWVGLTHEDIDKAIEDNQRFGGFRKVGFAYDLELVLKEKNT
jgi:hypothetical protein